MARETDDPKKTPSRDVSKKGIDKESIKEHPLVSKIVKDPNRPVNATILMGYIGKSTTEGVVRLYTNLEFSEYFEIKNSDILHSEEVSEDVIEFGGNRIWVDDNAEITRVRVETTKQQAMFLGGKVAEGYIRPTQRPPRRLRGRPRYDKQVLDDTPRRFCSEGGTQCGTCPRNDTCAWDSVCVCELRTNETAPACCPSQHIRSCPGYPSICDMNC